MPTLNISISTKRQLGLLRNSTIGSEALRHLVNVLESVASGREPSDGVLWNANDTLALGDQAFNGPACGVLVCSGGAGAMGATIDGTLVTAAFTTSDTVTAGLIAAAIRNSAAVTRKVCATNLGMQLTLASVTAGQYIDICNTRFTAVNGTPTDFGQFDMSGTDTADATSLALAINRHPSLSMRWKAVSAAAVVHLFPSNDRVARPFETLVNSGSFSTFTLNQAVPALGPKVGITAQSAGDIGNAVTVVQSGTGVTYSTANAGKLGGGTGGGLALQFCLP
jgi:hypothetical protein